MDRKGPLFWLKQFLSKKENQEKKNTKYQYLLIVGLFGALIMLVNNILLSKDSTTDKVITTFQNQTEAQEDVEAFGNKTGGSGNKSISDYESAYESELKEALEEMLGVNKVTVIVNVDATDKKVLEKNTVTQTQITDEVDREGGKRKVEDSSVDEQLVIVRTGEKEGPILVETKKPAIRGVLVVAEGAKNIQVKKWIIEAVTRVLDVPSHRVAVMPKKSKGDS